MLHLNYSRQNTRRLFGSYGQADNKTANRATNRFNREK
jgi:hypothetical protein